MGLQRGGGRGGGCSLCVYFATQTRIPHGFIKRLFSLAHVPVAHIVMRYWERNASFLVSTRLFMFLVGVLSGKI